MSNNKCKHSHTIISLHHVATSFIGCQVHITTIITSFWRCFCTVLICPSVISAVMYQMCTQSRPDMHTHSHNMMLLIVHLPHCFPPPPLHPLHPPHKLPSSLCPASDHRLTGPDLTGQEEPATTTLCINIELELFSQRSKTTEAFLLTYEITEYMLCIHMAGEHTLCLETVNWPRDVRRHRSHW